MKYRNMIAAVSALAICAVPFSAFGSLTASAEGKQESYTFYLGGQYGSHESFFDEPDQAGNPAVVVTEDDVEYTAVVNGEGGDASGNLILYLQSDANIYEYGEGEEENYKNGLEAGTINIEIVSVKVDGQEIEYNRSEGALNVANDGTSLRINVYNPYQPYPEGTKDVDAAAFSNVAESIEVTFKTSGLFEVEEVKDYTEASVDGVNYHVYADHAVVVGADTANVVIQDEVEGQPVTEIAEDAFKDATITNLHIGKNISTVDAGLFSTASGISHITVDNEHEKLASYDGVLYTKDYTTLVLYPSGSGAYLYEMPYKVTTIGDHAFENNRLGMIITSDALEKVGNYAFANSQNLKSVRLPQYVVSVGEHAFENCPNLEEVIFESACTLPQDATTISNGAKVPEDAQPAEDGTEPEAVPYFDGTIYAIKGSDAEKYATTYKYKYVESETQKMIIDEELGRTTTDKNSSSSSSSSTSSSSSSSSAKSSTSSSSSSSSASSSKSGAPQTSDKLPTGLATIATAILALGVFSRRKDI